MPRLFFLLMIVMHTGVRIYAQQEDNIWIFGYDYNPGDGLAEGVYFTFGDSLEVSYHQRPMSILKSSASICDTAGNLLIYSNGCYVETADGTEVENSEGLNPGALYNNCEDNDGYNISQNMIILTDPKQGFVYHLFHLPSDIPPGTSGLTYAVMHSKFNMEANNSNGTTILKNQIIISDTIHNDGIHAVRHANGRDWWIISAKQFSNRYFLLHLSPTGVEVKEQELGEPTTSYAQGQIVFSPDGTKLARFNARDDLRIFDFDRCSGELSAPVYIPMQNAADIEIFSGMAWSADSRFICAAENARLLQFDTWAPDIAGS
ncbi:MAG: hypothetical protein IPK76_19895, partial [Lewinellaceae bacterium]|nr:hypothetical protein [Lewinellaceae bacterium]